MKLSHMAKQLGKVDAAKPASPDSFIQTGPDQSELDELREFCSEQGQNLKATLEDNDSMARVFDADDKIAVAMAEAKRFREMNRVLESRNTGLMNELAEVKRLLNSAQRRADKAESALKEPSHAG